MDFAKVKIILPKSKLWYRDFQSCQFLREILLFGSCIAVAFALIYMLLRKCKLWVMAFPQGKSCLYFFHPEYHRKPISIRFWCSLSSRAVFASKARSQLKPFLKLQNVTLWSVTLRTTKTKLDQRSENYLQEKPTAMASSKANCKWSGITIRIWQRSRVVHLRLPYEKNLTGTGLPNEFRRSSCFVVLIIPACFPA